MERRITEASGDEASSALTEVTSAYHDDMTIEGFAHTQVVIF
jgi:hypothetical protein